MEDIAHKEFEAHLAEYSALRGEISQYNQRIDRTVGVYLSALVGLAGYLLRPESTFNVSKYIESVSASATQATLMIVLGILNGLLFLRLQSFFLAVLAMSQYTATVIRPRIAELLRTGDVLRWDGADVVRAKRYWLPSRHAAQHGFGIVAVSLSVGAAALGVPQATKSLVVAALFVILVGIVSYSVYTSVRIAIVGSRFLEEPASLPKNHPVKSSVIPQNTIRNGEVAPDKGMQPTGNDAGG